MRVVSLRITPKQGGFIIRVSLEEKGVGDYTEDEYIVKTYAQVLKAVKTELDEYKPVRKPKEKVNAD